MADVIEAEQLAREIHEAYGVPVFPVLITRDETTGKWQKVPLTKWRHLEGMAEDGWEAANAVGVPMGSQSGLITIDLDDYKGDGPQKWLEKHGSPATLEHATASGGRHLIFRLPDGLLLGNRSPAVQGVDIRATGGYIVWADVFGLYSIVDGSDPAPLPKSLADELVELRDHHRDVIVDDRALPRWEPPARGVTEGKLMCCLLKVEDARFAQRWHGEAAGMKDTSRSAMDMAMASMLAKRDFDYHEIVEALLEFFEHGTSARDGQTDDVLRSAMRCAARATKQQQATKADKLELARRLMATTSRRGKKGDEQ